MMISSDIAYVGAADSAIRLFEGQYNVPGGMTYNSYIIMDGKTAVIDGIDAACVDTWLKNIAATGRTPDYLIVQHMEPDHNAGIAAFMKAYPSAVIVTSKKAFPMLQNFFGTAFEDRRIEISEGSELSLGRHTLKFIAAPMVHWPEVMVTYDSEDGILFSADGFGRFGNADESAPWDDEARRYYIGIVGKYGMQVGALLKKAAALDIKTICPLHGPVLTKDLGHYIDKYMKWSSYEPEESGVLIAYASIYGGTRRAALELAEMLQKKGVKTETADLARGDMAQAVALAFKYDRLVLASVTYNADIFPAMRQFIEGIAFRGYRNRRVALVENGSWAPAAANIMKKLLSECKDIEFCEHSARMMSVPNASTTAQLEALAEELTASAAPAKEEAAAPAGKKFVCKICGYVHEADELPDDFTCPLCKHPASDFEEVKPELKTYVCKVCGYEVEAESLPDDYRCPLCKAPASKFECK